MLPGFHRHQPSAGPALAIKAGLGGCLAIASVALASQATGNPWLMAPFGATCVLLFSVPASPLSQPANVVGGHLVAALVGLIMLAFLPVAWWSMALAVGLAIALMALLRVTHPPAGANPLVMLLAANSAGEAPGVDFLLFPVLSGSILLVLLAVLVHRLPPRTPYPLGK